ncbi:MAG: DUF4340 domain-containing protein [Clostridia bacterium]|nr:DUF4340 domain-containing protein [Clostridia bacterium]
MRRWWLPLAAAAVFALLLFYVLEVDRREPAADGKEEPRLATFETGAVDEIEIGGPEGKLLFKRRPTDGFAWWLEPQHLPANDTRLEYLLQTLANLRGKPVAATEAEAGAFGLERPAWQIELRGGGQTLLALAVGEAVPVTGSGGERLFYARLGGRPEIYTVPGWVIDDCAGKVDDWRERYLAELPTPEVGAVEVAWDGRRLAARRKEERWFLSVPGEGEVDAGKVRTFINRVTFMEAREFVSDRPETAALAGWGLDRPWLVAKLATADGSLRRELLLGKRAPGRPLYYAKLADHPWVYLVEARSVEELQAAATELLQGRE